MSLPDPRISVEGRAARPSRMPLAAVVVGALVLAGFVATADFSGSEDIIESTTTLAATSTTTTTSTPVSTTTPAPALAFLPTRTLEAGLLETPRYEWERVAMPSGMERVGALGRFEGDLIAVGGPLTDAGTYRRLAVAKWFSRSPTGAAADSTWFPTGFVTGRELIVHQIIVEPDLIVVVGEEAPTPNALHGSVYAFVSGNGVIFDEYRLGTGAEVTDVTAVVRRGESVWMFGGHLSDPWSEILAALPREQRTLIADDLVAVVHDAGDVVLRREPGLEIAREAIFDVLGYFVDPDGPREWTARVWTLDAERESLSGGRFADRLLQEVPSPFGDAVVDHARLDDLGDLLVDVRFSGSNRHESWRRVDDEWERVAEWAAGGLRAVGGDDGSSVFVDRSDPGRLVLVDQEGARPLEFEIPLHDIDPGAVVRSRGGGTILGTTLTGNLNPPAMLETGRDLTTVRVRVDGTTSVWRAGTLIYSAPLVRLAEQGSIDIERARITLADDNGEELTYVDFGELRVADPERARVAGAVGVLFSPDLAAWTFTELKAPGRVVAAHIDQRTIMVATGVPAGSYSGLQSMLWRGSPVDP